MFRNPLIVAADTEDSDQAETWAKELASLVSHMKVGQGMKVNLFASEKEFPVLSKPVQMAWDTKGRLWVAVWPNYPERTPDSKSGDSLLMFEDTDGEA